MHPTQPPFRCYNWSPPLGPFRLHSNTFFLFARKPRRLSFIGWPHWPTFTHTRPLVTAKRYASPPPMPSPPHNVYRHCYLLPTPSAPICHLYLTQAFAHPPHDVNMPRRTLIGSHRSPSQTIRIACFDHAPASCIGQIRSTPQPRSSHQPSIPRQPDPFVSRRLPPRPLTTTEPPFADAKSSFDSRLPTHGPASPTIGYRLPPPHPHSSAPFPSCTQVQIFFFPFFSFLPRIGIRRSRIHDSAYLTTSRTLNSSLITIPAPPQLHPHPETTPKPPRSVGDVGTDSDNGYHARRTLFTF